MQNAQSLNLEPLTQDDLNLAGGEFKAVIYAVGIGLELLAFGAAATGVGAGAAIGLGAAGVAVAESAF